MMLNFTGENMSATHQWKYSGHLEQTTIFLPFLFWSNCLIFLEDLLNWNWNLNNEDGEEKTKELTRNKHSHIALLLELFLQIPANLNCLMSSEKGPFFFFSFFSSKESENGSPPNSAWILNALESDSQLSTAQMCILI